MNILKDVQTIGKSNRTIYNLLRRSGKTTEEVGELSEAVLSITSKTNPKNKKYMDVVEEACDVAIMGLDIALTKPPDMEYVISDEEWQTVVEKILAAKLEKWRIQIELNRTLISDGAVQFDQQELDDYMALLESPWK